eukprot:663879-Hanusia_phi.AAC.3
MRATARNKTRVWKVMSNPEARDALEDEDGTEEARPHLIAGPCARGDFKTNTSLARVPLPFSSLSSGSGSANLSSSFHHRSDSPLLRLLGQCGEEG